MSHNKLGKLQENLPHTAHTPYTDPLPITVGEYVCTPDFHKKNSRYDMLLINPFFTEPNVTVKLHIQKKKNKKFRHEK